MILVRKGEERHCPMKVEGDQAARRYIIIDDFIDSGHTVRTIVKEVKEFAPEAECLGVLQVTDLPIRITRKLN